MKIFKEIFFVLLLLSCNAASNGNGTKSTEFRGMFTYMADANMFFPCDGTQRMPVAMIGEYLTLEKKYMSLADGSGERIFARFEGYTKEVPAMEGDGKEIAIVVTKVLEVDKGKSCE